MDRLQPDPISQQVARQFVELGASNPPVVTRTILLREGQFAGHRFRCGAMQAFWWTDRHEIDFRDEAGQTLHTIRLDEAANRADDDSSRRAA
jgi:hypothetical protein